MAECRLYRIAHLQSSRSELRWFEFNWPYHRTNAISGRIRGSFLDRPLFLTPDTPCNRIQAGCGLSESCPKIGDVPKSPFRAVAVLVPSAGAIQYRHLRCGCPMPTFVCAPSSARVPRIERAKAMQVPSRLPGESLNGVADAKENCTKIEAVVAEEMVGADTDAAFESVCRLIVMKSLPAWIEEARTEHLQAVRAVWRAE
jgi:hypothetical protein